MGRSRKSRLKTLTQTVEPSQGDNEMENARQQYDDCLRINARIMELLDFFKEIGHIPLDNTGCLSDFFENNVYLFNVSGLENIANVLNEYPYNEEGTWFSPSSIVLGGRCELNCVYKNKAVEDNWDNKTKILRHVSTLVSDDEINALTEKLREDRRNKDMPANMLDAAVRERDYMIKAAEGKQLRECNIIKENMKNILEFIQGLRDFMFINGKQVDKVLCDNIYTSTGNGDYVGLLDIKELLDEYPKKYPRPDSHGNVYGIPSFFAFMACSLETLWFSENKNEGPDPLIAVQDISEIKKKIIDWAVKNGALKCEKICA
jgi:hypothetical protein